ncbi:dual specificity protein phosphatase 14-like [Haliotis asinina]|uniref:dual specificity protein phosphatase 14-like n=1 Tax=Haliotis asinina TaxID=109174 RepID=UPI00353183A1
MDRHMFDQIAKITDSLFLSSAAAVRGDRVVGLGITHIINCTMDVPNLNVANVECIQIHVDDTPSARLSLYFDRCSDKIDQIARRGGRALVHCVAGVSRSASLCIAYLMKHHHMSLRQAYWHVRARRSVIHPNFGFWRQLIDFERRLTGTTSVKMIHSGIGYIPDVLEEETRNMIWFGPQSTAYSRAYGGGTLRSDRGSSNSIASSSGGGATYRSSYGGGTYRSRYGRY